MTERWLNKIICGDCLEVLRGMPDGCVQCCVTSPPYWGLRDYGIEGQLGLESTPEEYVAKMVEIFREVKRVLRDDGTLWLNLGDSYWNNFGGGSDTMTTGNAEAVKIRGRNNKPKHNLFKIKDLIGIPWRVAFALQADGWYLRSDIIWHKPNPMPESVTDRPTKSHEYIFLMSKSQRYYYDGEAIKEPAQNWGTRDRTNFRGGAVDPKLKHHGLKGSNEENQFRNKRSVWTVTTKSYPEAHFATFPPDLIKPCILAGCPEGGVVLDPFIGSGTTAEVCCDLNRRYIGIELNQEYIKLAEARIAKATEQMRLFI